MVEVIELEEDFTSETASKYGIPSWKAYRSFWASHYPNLRVSRPAEDICLYCYKFHNRFRYNKQRPNLFQQPSAKNDDHPSGIVCPSAAINDVSGAGVVNAAADKQEDNNNDGVVDVDHASYYASNEEVDEGTLASEREILKAGEHVKMARAQHALVNEKMEQAKANRCNKVRHSDRT